MKNIRTASEPRSRASGSGDRDAKSRAEDAAKRAEQQIHQLSTAIQKFRIDAQRFFAGDLPMPPDEQRDRIQDQIRRLRGSNLQGAAVNFRLGSLEAQFNSHLELFGRRLRQREVSAQRARVAESASSPNPAEGVVIGRQADAQAVEALYKGLYPTIPGRQPKMNLGRFRDYLDRQAAAIRGKTGCNDIQFRVAVEGGKMKLKAKPLRR